MTDEWVKNMNYFISKAKTLKEFKALGVMVSAEEKRLGIVRDEYGKKKT